MRAAPTSACRTEVVDDDGVLQVDEIVVAVGEEGEPAIGTCPARRRVSGRDELRRDRRRRTEGSIVEHRQILAHRVTRIIGRLPRVTWDRVLPVGIGLDHGRVDRERLTADEPLSNAALNRLLEQPSEHVAVTKAAVSVLREG